MKRCLMFLLLLAAALTSIGCGDGVVSTSREREFRHSEQFKNDMRQLTDDWDYFWLQEHKGRLSRWEITE